MNISKIISKIAASAVSLTIGISIIPAVQATAQNDLSVYTTPAIISADNGEAFSFDIMIKNPNMQTVTSSYIWMSYDPSLLEGIEITAGEKWNNTRDMYFDKDYRLLKIGVYNGYQTNSTPLKVATVTMKPKTANKEDTIVRFYQYPNHVVANVLDGQNEVNALQTPPAGVTVSINKKYQEPAAVKTGISRRYGNNYSQAPDNIRFPSVETSNIPNSAMGSEPAATTTTKTSTTISKQMSVVEPAIRKLPSDNTSSNRNLRFKTSQNLPQDTNARSSQPVSPATTAPQDDSYTVKYRNPANLPGVTVQDSASGYRATPVSSKVSPTVATSLPKTGLASVAATALLLGMGGAVIAVRRRRQQI